MSLRSFVVVAVVVPLSLAALAPAALGNGILVADGNGSPVRLEGHRVTATIRDGVADVTVEQTFHSSSDRPLEGTYLFPLPRGAAVSKFAMTMGGTMVEGEVVEAKTARRVYEEIVSKRRDPGLLEWVGSGLFRARVFPIEPGRDLTIRLSFQEVLADDAGTLEWRYPLATDRLNGAPVARVLVDVAIESTVDLKAVYCPSHRVAVVRDGERRARVTHEREGARQDRDLVLYVGRSREDVGFSLVSGKRVAQDGTFMAVIAPRVDVEASKRVGKDIVYVLDVSGSMQGEKIVQARAALAYGVRRLDDRDRFAVLAFSTGVQHFREGMVAATREAREAAAAWIGGLAAEGGTNIAGALTAAVRLPGKDRLPVIVFVTDGRPTVDEADPAAILRRLTDANQNRARVFTFGVGHDLDVGLLDRIAEASGGTRDYVAPAEDIEVVTGRFFRKVDTPVLTDVTVDFGPGVHDVMPVRVPDLFAGEQVVLFGRYRDAGSRSIRLKGKFQGIDLSFEYPARLSDAPGPDFVPRLWAHRKVAYLLDQIRLHGANAELVDEVTRLATRHAIVTPYTSGLVLERDGVQIASSRRLRTRMPGGGLPPTPEDTEQVHASDVVAKEPTVKDGEVSDHNDTDNDLPTEESLGEGGISDAPFEGPRNNGLVGIGGSAGGAFQGRGGHRNLRAGGAGKKHADSSVEDALKWLAAHQSADGGWECEGFRRWCDGKQAPGEGPDGAGKASYDVGVTGMSLLAFLGAGYTNRSEGPFGRVVGDGLKYLKNVQDAEGCFGDRASSRFVSDHALATLAMVEAYGMTGSSNFKNPAQKALELLETVRDADGGWGVRGSTASDADTTTWATLALEIAVHIGSADAAAGKPPSIGVRPGALDRSLAWLEKAASTGSAIAQASALSLRLARGEKPTIGEPARLAAALASDLPSPGVVPTGLELSRRHWTTLALHRTGGEPWKRWEPAMRAAFVDSQRRDGDSCAQRGSWDPPASGDDHGRVGSTARMALSLEVWYLYDRAIATTSPPTPAPRPAADPASAATAESLALRRAKEATTVASDGHRSRAVGGKTFRRDADGRWVDTAWDGKAVPERVEAYTPPYFALVASSPDVARILSLGERVVFVDGARVVEIVPAQAAAPAGTGR